MKKLILGSLLVASSLFAGDVLAVVNGTKITKTEVNNLLKAQKITYDQLPPQYQKQILDKIITEALLIQKAQSSGVENTKLYKEELEKLKGLLDKGLITQEDYDAKKKEILGL